MKRKKQSKRQDKKQLALNLTAKGQIVGQPTEEESGKVISLSSHLEDERQRHERVIFSEILSMAEHLQT